jgi:hypothetical protein
VEDVTRRCGGVHLLNSPQMSSVLDLALPISL